MNPAPYVRLVRQNKQILAQQRLEVITFSFVLLSGIGEIPEVASILSNIHTG